MRVIFAEDFADDLGALARGAIGREAHFAHGVEDAAMDRFEAVADVGKGASYDHAHRVIHVRALHLVFDVDVDVALVVVAARTRGWGSLRGRRRALRGIFLVSHVLLVKLNYSVGLGGIATRAGRSISARARTVVSQ